MKHYPALIAASLALSGWCSRPACATPISLASVTCDGVTTSNATSATCSAGGSGANATLAIGSATFTASTLGSWAVGHSDSATATFQNTFVLTVTSGPAQGFFLTCISGSGDPGAVASGSFGGASASGGGGGLPFGQCVVNPYLLGVAQTLSLSLSASAIASNILNSTVNQSQVVAQFGPFYDSSNTVIPGVTYTLTQAGVPEPGTFALSLLPLLAGLSMAALRRP